MISCAVISAKTNCPRILRQQITRFGFLVSPDGYILTCGTCGNATEILVRLTDRREFTAKVIGADAAQRRRTAQD